MTVNVCVTGEPRMLVRSVEVALSSSRATDDTPWSVSVQASTELPSDAPPDVIVVVGLTGTAPKEIDSARRSHPRACVVWLAGEPTGGAVADAVARGCSSVITQRSDLSDLVNGVERASHGESWTTPDLVGELMDELRTPRRSERGGLSHRELEVLTLLRAGRSTTEIADALFISGHTTKNHVRRILRKLDAHSRLEAVAIAERDRLLDPLARSLDRR